MPQDTDALLAELRSLYMARAGHFLKAFRRLPAFGDMVADRWEKARLLGFAEGASIYDSALVFGDVSVGANTWIGPNVILDGSGGAIRIGSYCSISAGTQIYTHQSVAWALTGGRRPYVQAPVSIGDNVYIGPDVTIACGVRIGSRCIIGAHSLITGNLDDDSAAWGCPARVVGVVELDDSEQGYIIRHPTPSDPGQ